MTTIMNNLEERDVCRLCLEAAFGYCLSITEEVASDISDVLLSYLDFHISDNPGMCKQCEENLHKAVSFKSSRKMLLSPYTGGAESTDTKQCNFCISYPVQVRPVPDAGNNVFLLEILREIGKKLKTVSTDNPVACDSCFCIIQDILQFTKTCLKTEEKIRKYIEIEGLNPNGKVDLDDVQTFATKSIKWGFNELEVTEADVTKTILEKSNIDNMNYISTNSTEVNNVDGTYAETKLEVMNNFSVKEEVCEEGKLEFNENEKSVTLTVNNSAKKIHLIPTENLKIENNSEEIYIKEEEMEIKSEDDFDSSKMSDSDEDNVLCTPPEITPQAMTETNHLLPAKSWKRYKITHDRFMHWRLRNNIKSFSENVLLAYFEELSKTIKPSSLWAVFSMLKTTLNKTKRINIANYTRLIAKLKRNTDGFKSNILTAEQINTFIQNAPDSRYLLMKVILIVAVSGECRKHEMRNIKCEHIEDTGNSLIIVIPDSKTKSRRSFVIPEPFYTKCKEYINLRPSGDNIIRLPFFVHYQQGKCIKQCVGINTFASTPKKIAEYLGLPDAKRYNVHCFRRTASILVDTGGDLLAQ